MWFKCVSIIEMEYLDGKKQESLMSDVSSIKVKLESLDYITKTVFFIGNGTRIDDLHLEIVILL